jgi:hypothetical protein
MNVEVDVTEEDMDAYRPPKRQKSDPMNKIGSDKLPDYKSASFAFVLFLRTLWSPSQDLHNHDSEWTQLCLECLFNFASNVYSCRRSDCKIVEWTNI